MKARALARSPTFSSRERGRALPFSPGEKVAAKSAG